MRFPDSVGYYLPKDGGFSMEYGRYFVVFGKELLERRSVWSTQIDIFSMEQEGICHCLRLGCLCSLFRGGKL